MKRNTHHSSFTTHHSSLVPRLRFPEFRDAGPWEVKRLGEMGHFFRGLSYSPKEVSDQGLLVLRAGNLQEGKISLETDLVFVSKSCSEDILLRRGDIVVCMSNGSKLLVGKSGEVDRDFENEMTAGAFCAIFRPTNVFARFAFQTPKYETFIKKNIAGGNINNLKNSDLEEFEFYIPLVSEEQQKIADCLSSLDELIELQAKKLEALKAHKKGLMQQIFPREGETTPRLRFPEFRNAGPWENIQVSDFGAIVTGKTPSTSNPKYWNGQFAWVTPTDISDAKYIYTTDRLLTSEGVQLIGILPENTVLITCIASIGKNAILKVPGSCNQQINAIIPNSNFNSDFIYYLFCKNQTILQNQAGTSATAIIPKSAFEKLYFHVPKLPEQQKIADCLSSLDELIQLEAKKLEALKAQKKGLMQQLFPQEISA